MQEHTYSSTPNETQGVPNRNHGGHELFDMHEVLGCSIHVLDQFMIFRSFIQDNELVDILDRQYHFMLSQYNLTAECFTSGSKPSQETSTYMIKDMTEPIYGNLSSQSNKPSGSLADVKDAGISGYMLGLIKTHASLLTNSAFEVTNPVVRRVLASQVQNFIEMGYEIFLYQNKHNYYQIPQLEASDMQKMLTAYVPATGSPKLPANNKAKATVH